MKRRIVIVGAGHAGVQAAASLRDEGFDGSIRLIDAGRELPYQRPPLSKAYLKGEATAESLVLRGEAFYRDKAIDLALGESVIAIDRAERRLSLSSGGDCPYDALILATGARARPLTVPGGDLEGVHALRDLADAARIKEEMSRANDVVVIGAGFIGLEFAAVAAKHGIGVTVLEMQPRVMARAISEPMSAAFQAKHAALGVHLLLGEGVAELRGIDGRVKAAVTTSGRHLPADMVIAGIGVLAEDRLAGEAGLALGNGILVDAHLATSDPAIFAIGDNNNHENPFYRGRLRLESVQNALDEAKCVARNLTGKREPYRAVPWFWSDQADFKLQIAGVSKGLSRLVLRGDRESGAFSVFGFAGDRLAVVESVNRPADHMIARRLLGEGIALSPAEAADPAFELKGLLTRPVR
ncbi:MAG: FAD-dependent oxidoreductase [Methylocystis sp.]|nr:FAD-dependent oxidoreductase [Methylocystis sp.]MCA3583345.1 FAD-dependent oxidoreductase [Methylocystis sp.]MCA3588832.1 FAD-dependent oxidoreductase [Methylocystis sp.]MCA3591864.1 FAD-dependent oxidoreductase [Methylocystis sp.]